MEEIKDIKDAWEGDLIEYKNKILRVIHCDIIEAGHFKQIKAVKVRLWFPFTKVYEIVV